MAAAAANLIKYMVGRRRRRGRQFKSNIWLAAAAAAAAANLIKSMVGGRRRRRAAAANLIKYMVGGGRRRRGRGRQVKLNIW